MQLPATPAAWHRRVWSLTWPVIAANVTIPLVGLVDTAVMGHLPDARFIGAVALGGTAFSFVYWGLSFLRMGTTGIVAQAFGAGDGEALGGTWLRGVICALALGLSIVVLQRPLVALVLAVYPASSGVESLAREYILVRVWGAPGMLLYFVAAGVLFGLQRMRATLLVVAAMNLVNVGLDLLLVVGLGWGVAGVALASAIAEWFGGLLGAALAGGALARHGAARRHRAMLLDGPALRAFFAVSVNLIVRSFCLQVALVVFAALGARQGDVVLAANALLMQFVSGLAFALDGVAHAAEALAGAAWGARDAGALGRAVRFTLLWAGIVALGFALLFALAGDALIAVLTDIAEVRASAGRYLPWVVAMPLIGVWAFQFDGIYIGTTRVREMRNTMLVSLAAFLLLVAWLPDALGNHGLWLAYLGFLGARGISLGMLWPRIARQLDQRV